MTAEGRESDSLRSSDILSSVKEKRTLLEKILSVFPGYRGYKEKELLRETDKLIRDVVYRNMKEVSDRIRTLYRDAISSLGLSQEVRMLERLSNEVTIYYTVVLFYMYSESVLRGDRMPRRSLLIIFLMLLFAMETIHLIYKNLSGAAH